MSYSSLNGLGIAHRVEGSVEMDVPLSTQSIVVATSEQVSCQLGEESVILHLKNSVYYGMNPVGASVWKLLQQQRSVAELRDAVLDEYEVEAERCERDLLTLLEEMRNKGLIQVVSSHNEGPS
ncbi:MAG: PqqD family protein [Candidatus Acidiferrales bacterium]